MFTGQFIPFIYQKVRITEACKLKGIPAVVHTFVLYVCLCFTFQRIKYDDMIWYDDDPTATSITHVQLYVTRLAVQNAVGTYVINTGFCEWVRFDQHASRSSCGTQWAQTQLAQRGRRHPALPSCRLLLQAGTLFSRHSWKMKTKGRVFIYSAIYTTHSLKALRRGSHSFYLQITSCLPFLHKRSQDGATPN